MTDILQRLRQGRVLVSDCGMGTQLQGRGMPSYSFPEAMNLDHPEVVTSIHEDCLQAGADIIEANTFGANRRNLGHYNRKFDIGDICRSAVNLARNSAGVEHYVVGSIGPTGAMIEPSGTMTREKAGEFFSEPTLALFDAGVDLFFIETMVALEEAEAAIQQVKHISDIPVAVTMTFDSGPRGFHTAWGVNIADYVKRMNNLDVDILGANCGRGYEEAVKIAREMRQYTDKYLLLQPNAGLPEYQQGEMIYPQTPETIIDLVHELLDLKVNIIGGCCGTTPEHIQVIRSLTDTQNG